jgi:hypothetical protein
MGEGEGARVSQLTLARSLACSVGPQATAGRAGRQAQRPCPLVSRDVDYPLSPNSTGYQCHGSRERSDPLRRRSPSALARLSQSSETGCVPAK